MMASSLTDIDAIFFDLDDTLFDATSLAEKARRAAIEAMIEKGLSCITPEQGYDILKEIVTEFGSNYDGHFNMLLKRLNASSSKLITQAIITYHRIKVQEIRLYTDVFGFLQNLKQQPACKLGIITDGLPIKQWEKIIRLGLDVFFPFVFISDEIGIRKPNPKLYTLACEKVGAPVSRSLYIGDRFDQDVLPAKQAGLLTCFLHRGGKYDRALSDKEKESVDFEVRDLDELLQQLSTPA